MEGERDGGVEVYVVTRNATRAKRGRDSEGGERQLDPIDPSLLGRVCLQSLQSIAEQQGWSWAVTGLLVGVSWNSSAKSGQPRRRSHRCIFRHS